MSVSILAGDAIDRLVNAAENIAKKMGSGGEEATWDNVPLNVRGGYGEEMYPVGTVFEVNKESSMTASKGNSTGITGASVNEDAFLEAIGEVKSGIYEFSYDGAAWHLGEEAVSLTDYGISVTGTAVSGDHVIITEAITKIYKVVVDHDNPNYAMNNGHNMILYDLYCIYGREVSPRQALIIAPEGLSAGTYHFTVKNHVWATSENDKVYQFTLPVDIPAGGQGVMQQAYNATLAGGVIKWYSGPMSTTELASTAMSLGSGGTDLGQTDGAGTYLNHMHRAIFGNNYTGESKHDLWFNSDAAAGAWDAATTAYDRPASYASVAGYMHGMDPKFLKAVAQTDVPCSSNQVFEHGHTLNSAYTLKKRKFFGASMTELGLGANGSVSEGRAWSLYDGAAQADRIKYDLAAKTTARYYWLRSPNPWYASHVRVVDPGGSLNGNFADNGLGAAAACVVA